MLPVIKSPSFSWAGNMQKTPFPLLYLAGEGDLKRAPVNVIMNYGIFFISTGSIIFGVAIEARGYQTFSVTGQVINILGYAVPVTISQLCLCGMRADTDDT